MAGKASSLGDDELKEILDRVKTRLLRAKCCRPLEPGYDVGSASEVKEIINDCALVLIFFYSPTCPYCKILYPLFVEVGYKFKGLAAFIAVDVSRFPMLASAFKVFGVPTIVFVARGRPVARVPGLIDVHDLESSVERLLVKLGCYPIG